MQLMTVINVLHKRIGQFDFLSFQRVPQLRLIHGPQDDRRYKRPCCCPSRVAPKMAEHMNGLVRHHANAI